MNRFVYRSLLTAFIISTVFFLINIIDEYMERRFITGYQKVVLKAPLHFVLIFITSLCFLYLFSYLFQVRK